MVRKRHAPFWYWLCYPFEFTMESLRQKIKISRNKMKKYEEIDVSGKVVVITGANSGLGKYTAKEMAKRGAIVVMGCRNLEKAEQAKVEIMEESKSTKVELYRLDLSEFSTVRSFASEVIKNHSVIDILINCGGICLNYSKQALTKEVWDLQMTTNHLGHFLLTNQLINSILPSTISRVVTISSTLCIPSMLDTDDIMLTNTGSRFKLGLGNMRPYHNSKLANALFTKSLTKKYPTIKAFSVCPGLVRTEVFESFEDKLFDKFAVWISFRVAGFEVENGVDTIMMCCLGKDVGEGESGGYFRFRKRVKRVEKMLREEVAEELWNVSEKYVG